jgi:hypothetical protein
MRLEFWAQKALNGEMQSNTYYSKEGIIYFLFIRADGGDSLEYWDTSCGASEPVNHRLKWVVRHSYERIGQRICSFSSSSR